MPTKIDSSPQGHAQPGVAMAEFANARRVAEAPSALEPARADQHSAEHAARSAKPVPGVAFGAGRHAGLVVGHAADPAEADADRLADQALRRLAENSADGATDAHEHEPSVRRSGGGSRGRSSGGAGGGAIGPIGAEGGELDAGTAGQITGRLGTGSPLTDDVRRTMETAFGRSFGNVGVHTDAHAAQLNRHLSSTAFTVGNDIFFSPGAYRPAETSGRRLLAHELAHVAQQSGSAQRRIQRAVGFEFETNLIAHQIDDPVARTTKPLPKMYVIKAYPEGFRMEADENSSVGSTIEFVVDPPVQEGDRKSLVKIMKKMAEVTKALAYKEPTVDYVTPTVQLSTINGTEVTDANVLVLPVKYVTANPQVTGGIAFDKVIDMMSEIGNGDQSDLSKKEATSASALERISPDRPSTLANRVKAAAPPLGLTSVSKKLQGLAALIASYVEFGAAAAGNPLNYAKLISGSLLVRTDFGTLFMQLPSEEVQALSLAPDNFVNWIIGISGVTTGADAPVFERGVYAKNAPRTGVGADTTLSDVAELKITRKDWLEGITGGVDWLSSKRFPEYKANLEGLGGIGKNMDAVGKEVKKGGSNSGVVMEFRRMRQNVDYGEWSGLALGIFDYLSGISKRS